jgi:hypothetical protein
MTAQTDYSQLVSQGPIELAGAIVVAVSKPSEKALCPVLAEGSTYTFISTTGTLSGTFANAPEKGPGISIDFAKNCVAQSAKDIRIHYNRSGGTETVTGTVEEAKERQEEESAATKKHEEEVEKEEAIRKLVEGHAKQVGEEAATREIAAKKQQEEAVTAAATAAVNKTKEEAAAKKKLEEGKAKSTKPPTRAQLLTKALKQCKKEKPKSKRVKCETTAKKKYGPKKKIKKK